MNKKSAIVSQTTSFGIYKTKIYYNKC